MFLTFFTKKKSAGLVFFSGGGVVCMGSLYGKKWKITFSSEANSIHYQCFYYVSGTPPIPYNSLNSPSSPFYGHFAKTIFSIYVCMYTYIYILKNTWTFGTKNWTPFGPNGYFPGTFWRKPSLLGLLRSLKKFLPKSLIT